MLPMNIRSMVNLISDKILRYVEREARKAVVMQLPSAAHTRTSHELLLQGDGQNALFLDEDRMHVPLIVGSMTDEGFVSADNCYLRNSQTGESWRIPQHLCALPYAKSTYLEINLAKYSAKDRFGDCRLLIYFINTHTIWAASSLLQTCHHVSHHTVCMLCPPLQN
jgi:hypothetical protein